MALRSLVSFLLIALLTIGCRDDRLSDAAAASPARVALVIGNGTYQGVPVLRNPVNDARAFADKLSKLGFDVAKVEDGSKAEMNRAIAAFSRKLGPDTVSIFYYAGHAIQVNGHNFLVPVDAAIGAEENIAARTVAVDAVLKPAAAAQSRVALVILDASHNNPFERGARAIEGGLAPIDPPDGVLIAYATAPGKVAADGADDNGLYASQLLRILDLPGLKTEDVFKRVRFAVWFLSKGLQHPWEASSLTGDFYFRPTTDHPGEAIIPKQDAETWNEVKDAENPALIERYLRQFPAGAFVPLAKARVAELKSGAYVSKLPKPGRWQQTGTLCNLSWMVSELSLYVDGHDLYGWWSQNSHNQSSYGGEFLTRLDDAGEIAPVGLDFGGNNYSNYYYISGTFPAAVNMRITASLSCGSFTYSFNWVSEN
jgi:hypothetical protein